MARYYFLTTMLPELSLDVPPRITFEELIPLYLQNLTAADFEQFQLLRRWIDIQNLQLFWQGRADYGQALEDQALDPRGIWLKKALEAHLLTGENLPESVVDYLAQYEEDPQRLAHIAELLTAYLDAEIRQCDGFLHDYLAFERAWRLVTVALRAKRLGRDLAKELGVADPEEPLVAWLLSFRDAPTIEAPPGYQELFDILERTAQDPMGMRRALTQYRMSWAVERIQDQPFTLDYLLGYAVQLLLVEQWNELDSAAGEAIVEAMVAI